MEQLSFNQGLNFNQTPVFAAASMSRPVDDLARQRHQDSTRQTQVPGGNITEIILSEGQVENFQLLLPMLTQERRWLAWIDPPQTLVNKWQTMHGIVASQLLVLRSTADHSDQQLAERALSAGTCHAVVMWTGKLSRNAFGALQRASASGNSHGVVLRQR